MSDGMNN